MSAGRSNHGVIIWWTFPTTPDEPGAYTLVQSLGINGDTPKDSSSTKGMCVACSPDGFFVMMGCSDAAIRTYSQDTAGFRRAVHVSGPHLPPPASRWLSLLLPLLGCRCRRVFFPRRDTLRLKGTDFLRMACQLEQSRPVVGWKRPTWLSVVGYVLSRSVLLQSSRDNEIQ